MNDLGMSIKHAKRRGEWAELRFMACAAERGLCVSKPWGETSHYDFVVEDESSHLLRVQVKSTGSRKHRGYAVRTRGSQGAYPPRAFDFVAAYVIPEDVWYIIPEEIIQGKTTIVVCPGLEGTRYEPYREAWKLLGSAEAKAVGVPAASEEDEEVVEMRTNDAPPEI
jgi:hypothetical protein